MLEFISNTSVDHHGQRRAPQDPQDPDSEESSETYSDDFLPGNSIRPISKNAESRHVAWLESQRRAHFLILPDSMFERVWDLIVSIVSLLSVIKIPYDLAFAIPKVDFIFALNLLFDLVFILDIIFNFRRCFRTKWGIETNPKVIRQRYLRGWFVLDLIPAIPVDLLATTIFTESSDNTDVGGGFLRATDAAKFLRLPRLFRLLRLFRLIRIFSMRFSMGDPLSRILIFLFLTVLFIHWDACFEYLAVVLGGFPKKSWVMLSGLGQQPGWNAYMNSLYQACSHMLCVGYGFQPPETAVDKLVSMFSMLAGALMNAMLIASISALFSASHTSRERYNRMTDLVTDWLREHCVSPDLALRVKGYFQHRYPRQKAFDDSQVMGILSYSLQVDLKLELYMDFLWSEVHALRTAPEPLLRALCQKLGHAYHVPGDIIMAKGDIATGMYLTRQGELVAVDSQGRYLRSITEGDIFGHEGLLSMLRGQKGQCTYTVVCEAHCETLFLPVADFNELAENYDSWLQLLLLTENNGDGSEPPEPLTLRKKGQHRQCDCQGTSNRVVELQHMMVETLEHLKSLHQALGASFNLDYRSRDSSFRNDEQDTQNVPVRLTAEAIEIKQKEEGAQNLIQKVQSMADSKGGKDSSEIELKLMTHDENNHRAGPDTPQNVDYSTTTFS